jgi:hypothetical protein
MGPGKWFVHLCRYIPLFGIWFMFILLLL